MAYGACDNCGCAYEECECPSHRTEPENTMTKRPIENFNEHGTYIHDFRCFDIVRKLGFQEAFELMTKSEWITGEKPTSWKPYGPQDPDRPTAYFILNKGWAITEVNREKGYIEAVYCHDGTYSLYRTGVQAFLDRVRESISWNRTFRTLYERLTEPNEYA